MPWVRKGKSVYKPNGKLVGTSTSVAKAKRYLKALYMHAHKGASMSSRKSRYRAKHMSGETSVTSETPPKYHELYEGMSAAPGNGQPRGSRKSRYQRRTKKRRGLPPSGPVKHHELFEGMGFAGNRSGDQSPGLYQRLNRMNNLHNPLASVARGAVNVVNRVAGLPEARVSREGDLESDPRQSIAYHEGKIKFHRGEAKKARKAKNYRTAQAHEAQARAHEALRQYHRDQIGRFASFAMGDANKKPWSFKFGSSFDANDFATSMSIGLEGPDDEISREISSSDFVSVGQVVRSSKPLSGPARQTLDKIARSTSTTEGGGWGGRRRDKRWGRHSGIERQRGASMGSEAEREAARRDDAVLPPGRELSEHRRQRGISMSRKSRYHAKRGRRPAPSHAHRVAPPPQSRMQQSHSSMRYHAEHEARHSQLADQAAMRGDHELAKLHQGVAKAHGAARQHFRDRITPNKHHELMG